MIHTTEFKADHIARMDIQPHQEWMREAVANGYGDVLDRGVAQTVWNGETPIACFGQSLIWDNNAEVWSVFARDVGAGMVAVHRATKRLISKVSTKRLQAFVDAEFAPGVRWMLQLGFKVEGKLAGYFPNGNDAFLFAYVRGTDIARPFAMVDAYDNPSMLAKIFRLESEMAKLPQIDIEPVHHFSDGIYAREIFIPKGTLLTGKIHATEHLNIVSKGDISVMTDEGIKRIKAPATLVARAGMKRVGYAHEDTVWTTIHGTHETDLARLEAELITPANALTHEVNS